MDDIQTKVLSGFDGDELVEVLADLINIDSPTGYEGAAADYVERRFAELGLEARQQVVEDGRANVISTWRGGRESATLMFLGHLDTAPGTGLPRAKVVDGWVTGKGAANMKAAFACYYSAIKMLQSAEVPIGGELIVAAVCGEIERAPIGTYQGRSYRGGGLGARYMVTHGITADVVVNGEPTGRRVQLANCGYIFVRLTTRGASQHTAYRHHGVDAISKMMRVIEAVESWEDWYQRHYYHPYIVPRVGIGAIEGGYPPTPARSPADHCHLYVDITVLPGSDIRSVIRDFSAMIDGLRTVDPTLEVELEPYMTSLGYQIGSDEYIADAMRRAHRMVTGDEPSEVDKFRCNVSSDNSVLCEYGIRGITYGPGGRSRTQPGVYASYDEDYGEAVSIEDLALCAKSYALLALDVLSRPYDEVASGAHFGAAHHNLAMGVKTDGGA